MKRIVYNLLFLFVGSLVFISCEDDESDKEMGVSIADFYPAIVMEGTEITIIGTSLSDVDAVVLPGGVTTSDITVVDDCILKVIIPTGISERGEPLVVRAGVREAESRQTIRKAKPNFVSYLYTEKDGAVVGSNMTIIGNDLLEVEKVMLVSGEESCTIDTFQMLRKSNTSIKFTIPDKSPVGEGIQVKLIFKNGVSMDFPEMEIIGTNSNPFSDCDPITFETIMLNDFEHDREWCWTGGDITDNVKDENDNTYLYVCKPCEGWLLNCTHLDIGVIKDIEKYAIKIDVYVEEEVVGASKAVMQYVIGDTWFWLGENFFPETTPNGKYVTVTRNISDIKGDLKGDFDIGTKVNGLYGGVIPSGIRLDNLRLDPKKE